MPNKPTTTTTVTKPETLEEQGTDVSTGSLFDEKAGVAPEQTKPYKLDMNQDALKGALLLVGLAAVVVLAVVLLFKSNIDRAGVLPRTSTFTEINY